MNKFDFIWIPRGLAVLNFFFVLYVYILSLEIRLLGVSIFLLFAFLVLIYGKRNVALYYFLISLSGIIVYFLIPPSSNDNFIHSISFNMLLTLSLIIAIINTNLLHIFLWIPNQKVGNFKLENPRKIWNNKKMWIPRIVFIVAIVINLVYVLTKNFSLYKYYVWVDYGFISLLVLIIMLICFVLSFLLPIASAIFYFFSSILFLLLVYCFNEMNIVSLKLFGINLVPISFWLNLIGSLMLMYSYFKSYFKYEETVTCQSPISGSGGVAREEGEKK